MQRKRGRKSAAELNTPRPQPLEAYCRQPLPAELAHEEAEAYLAVINSQPADWFTPAVVPLMTQYARHIVQARRIAELLERAVGRRQTQWEYYTALLKAQRAETAAIASVATKLRLTPQSLRNDRGNIRIAAAPAGPPPWEWRPDGEGGVS
jgi:hypothetical protein